jgi:hypothetical protein
MKSFLPWSTDCWDAAAGAAEAVDVLNAAYAPPVKLRPIAIRAIMARG